MHVAARLRRTMRDGTVAREELAGSMDLLSIWEGYVGVDSTLGIKRLGGCSLVLGRQDCQLH